MKNITRALILTVSTFALLFTQSCGGNVAPAPTPVETMTKLLVGTNSKTWKIQTVNVNGVDQTNTFTGMTIQFSKANYTTTNGGVVWPSGSWSFTDDTATSFLRSDGITVSIVATETSLTLSMTWNKTTYGGGRVNSLAGPYVFKFN